MTDELTRVTAFVHGHVQGVGFRWWVKSQALELGLTGVAKNLIDGRVCVTAEGPQSACQNLVGWLNETPSTRQRPGSVELVVDSWSAPRGLEGFTTE